MSNSSDTIGNRTRDMPACSSMPQPTALPHTHFYVGTLKIPNAGYSAPTENTGHFTNAFLIPVKPLKPPWYLLKGAEVYDLTCPLAQ